MRYGLHLFLLSSLGILSACSGPTIDRDNTPGPLADAEMQAIYDAGDRRATEELLPYALSDRPAYRMAFARAMASVQDSTALPALEKLMTDPIPYVRLYAAFAVGQMGSRSSLPSLEQALKKATIPEIKAEILEAVGKCANPQAMEFLMYHDPNTVEEEIGKMYGIYRGTLNGLLLEDHLRTVAAHLSSTVSETRLMAAHILLRQKMFDLQPYCNVLADCAVNDSEGEVRLAAMQALRYCTGTVELAKTSAEKDPDPRVRSAAVTLLPTEGEDEEIEKILLRAMEDGSAWVAMSAASKYASLPEPELTAAVINLAKRTDVPEVRAAIAGALLDAGDQTSFDELWDATPQGISRAVVLSALTAIPEAENLLLEAAGWGPPEGTAALNAWLQSAETFPSRRLGLDSMARKAFVGIHPAKSSLFAVAMRNSVLASSIKVEDSLLRAALAGHGGEPQYSETISEIERTLAFRAGTEPPSAAPRYNNPPDWDRIASWPDSLIARLYAGGNVFEIELFVEEAPATVAYFVHLADSGWYDGTAFHRVVPCFVSQGGGHRGDGYGSAPQTIRSEFSMMRFTDGAVGMASAGKDTESAQFFITQAPAPHLDGRYTVFGRVTKGFSRLDEVSTGTEIDSVRVIY